jgi:hypothetical protein
MKTYTDTELIDALERAGKNGFCPGLINDDAGRWVISETGMQNCPNPKKAIDISTTFFIEAKEWKKTIRQAIIYWIEEGEKTD